MKGERLEQDRIVVPVCIEGMCIREKIINAFGHDNKQSMVLKNERYEL